MAIAGMDFRPDSEYLLADTPADTADQVRRLLENASLGREMAQNARARVRERYASKVQSERALELFRDIVACD
jgi:glycosyltransferase involved in cell wall biosynthesis